jgi:hypothetical protein
MTFSLIHATDFADRTSTRSSPLKAGSAFLQTVTYIPLCSAWREEWTAVGERPHGFAVKPTVGFTSASRWTRL